MKIDPEKDRAGYCNSCKHRDGVLDFPKYSVGYCLEHKIFWRIDFDLSFDVISEEEINRNKKILIEFKEQESNSTL